LLLAILLFACSPNRPAYIKVNGDIEGLVVEVDLNKISKTANGYELTAVLNVVSPLSNTGNRVMVTATDGTSALINYADAEGCFLVKGETGFNIVAENHPRVMGIKDIKEITIIAPIGENLKILHPSGTKNYSFGSSKLLFYQQEGVPQSINGQKRVEKLVPKQDTTVKNLINDPDVYVYFDDFDIVKANLNAVLIWVDGKIYYNKGNCKSVFGFVAGASNVIFDAFFDMKEALDNGEKVLTVLVDGLSLEQIIYFTSQGHNLGIFNDNFSIAASVNPAISNVALASIITGQSPYATGITARNNRNMLTSDIFDYALSLGKTAVYIEGNATLVNTNINQILSLPNANGCTDESVLLNALNTRQTNPDLLFVHFHGVDDINHEFSPKSDEALQRILDTALFIEALLEGFTGRVIIVSDHGQFTVDTNGTLTGNHGVFSIEDMFVPYYVFSK
jgi:hypothetical protein